MRKGAIYYNDRFAGILTEYDSGKFEFRYDDAWLADQSAPAISLTLPKTQQVFTSEYLFPFFFNMLSEGANKDLQCRLLKIDSDDHFGLLLATATTDTIGAITVKEIPGNK